MSTNKNETLVMAVFESKDMAAKAVPALKDWDKEQKDI